MAKKQKSMKGKGTYAEYRNENRYKKNKVKKLERHIKKYPNDIQAKERLAEIEKAQIEPTRGRPIKRGSCKPKEYGILPARGNLAERQKTALQQLAKLLELNYVEVVTKNSRHPKIIKKPRRHGSKRT